MTRKKLTLREHIERNVLPKMMDEPDKFKHTMALLKVDTSDYNAMLDALEKFYKVLGWDYDYK